MKLKDKKIRILAYESYTNGNGFPVEKWNVIHEGKLWAYYRQLSGKEFFAAATVNAEENVLFTVNRNRYDCRVCRGILPDYTYRRPRRI